MRYNRSYIIFLTERQCHTGTCVLTTAAKRQEGRNSMRLLIAGSTELYPGSTVHWTLETKRFFEQDTGVLCDCAIQPSDMARYDAVVVPGDIPDIHPGYWGGTPLDCCRYDIPMDRAQMFLIDQAVKLRKPIFGICRGYQLVAAYFGATLEQDIPHGDIHNYCVGKPRFHTTYNVPDTAMFDKMGVSCVTNSAHHQGIHTIPDCLKVTQLWSPNAHTADGYLIMAQEGTLRKSSADCIVEGVAHRDYPFLGVEWHPEMRGEFYCREIDLQALRNTFYDMNRR